MPTSHPIAIDSIRGNLLHYGGRTRAIVQLTDSGDTSAEHAREALYFAVLDGRAQVPVDVARALDLDGPEPRVVRPGSRDCPSCNGRAHRVLDGGQRWHECTHGCGWTSPKTPTTT